MALLLAEQLAADGRRHELDGIRRGNHYGNGKPGHQNIEQDLEMGRIRGERPG